MMVARFVMLASMGLAVPASAQGWRPGCGFGGDKTCMTVNFQLTAPMTEDVSGDWAAAVAKADKMLFDIVNKECSVLQPGAAIGCKMVSLNVSSNISPGRPGAGQSISATANATYQLGDAAGK